MESRSSITRWLGLLALLVGAGLLPFACGDDGGECVTDGDCESGEVCGTVGLCRISSPPARRDAGPPPDFGPPPDIGGADSGVDAGDMGFDAGDAGGDLGADLADVGHGGGGQVGPIRSVAPLTILDQDVILQIERRASTGNNAVFAGAGARVLPGSRSCTDDTLSQGLGLNGQECVIFTRDCDGPGQGLDTGNATFSFDVDGAMSSPLRSPSSQRPEWNAGNLTLGPFNSGDMVTLEMSTDGGGAGGLVAIPATEVPTPPDFTALNPSPNVPGGLLASQQISFSTQNGIGATLFFELYDEARTRVLRCVRPVAGGSTYRVDPGSLEAYRETLNPATDPDFFAKIGFEEAVTRSVSIDGGGTTEVAFSFQWVSVYPNVAVGN